MENHIGSRYARTTSMIMALFFIFMVGYCVGECFAKGETVELNDATIENTNDETSLTTLTRKYEDLNVIVVDDELEIEDYEKIQQEELIKENTLKNQIFLKINNTFTRPSSIDEVKRIFENYISEKSTDGIAYSGDKVLVTNSGDNILESGDAEELLDEVAEGENIIIEEGLPDNFIDAIDVTATAYCLCKKCCGKSPSSPGYGRTASGLVIVPGTNMKVIAVDPKLVKLGTHVYIQGLNGAADYGYAVAADTGGAIKNRKIDLYMDSHADCLKWGRRQVRMYILPD